MDGMLISTYSGNVVVIGQSSHQLPVPNLQYSSHPWTELVNRDSGRITVLTR